MRYRVDFYDMFDGWIGGTLRNKRAGEYYGVIDLEMRHEIDCPIDKPNEFDDLEPAKALRDKRNCELADGNGFGKGQY